MNRVRKEDSNPGRARPAFIERGVADFENDDKRRRPGRKADASPQERDGRETVRRRDKTKRRGKRTKAQTAISTPHLKKGFKMGWRFRRADEANGVDKQTVRRTWSDQFW